MLCNRRNLRHRAFERPLSSWYKRHVMEAAFIASKIRTARVLEAVNGLPLRISTDVWHESRPAERGAVQKEAIGQVGPGRDENIDRKARTLSLTDR